MSEIYTCIAWGLRDAGLPASTFVVEQYLSRNDFKGLIAFLQKMQHLTSGINMELLQA